MGMSVELQESHDMLEQVDLIVRNQGMGRIKAGPDNLSRFNYAVMVRHEDGTTLFFENAYAVLFRKKILMVFPEHSDSQVFHTEDLTNWNMYKGVGIPNVPEHISPAAHIEPQDTLVHGIRTFLRLSSSDDQKREIKPLVLEWLRSDNYPQLDLRDKVLTHIDPNFVSNDWIEDERFERRHNAEGVVVKVSDAHGLCYKVKYDDGTTGWFDPWELRIVEKAT